MKNKRILIPGGAGSIGSELVRQLSKQNKIYILDINESAIFELTDSIKQNVWGRVGDIRDYKTVRDVFEDFKPQIIFNCAAYKHVPLMEYTPLEAIQTNVIGHYNLVHVAKTWECVEKFVFVSTDKAVMSTSIMGATKRLGEIITKNQGKGYIVVRFGNVLGSRGSLMTIWQRQIDQGKSLTITDEGMTRYFMTIEEACELVIDAATIGKGGEIFILKMKQPMKIIDLAKKIIKESGKNIPMEIIGKRPGEILEEKLMFEEEEKIAIQSDKYFIIK